MRSKLLLFLAVGVTLAALAAGAVAKDVGPVTVPLSPVPNPGMMASKSGGPEGARLDTLWIFDATFENTTGDNTGWTAYDRSGTLGQDNYWHLDTIRTLPAYIGTYAWWCGTNDVCWRQPRGYGNNWLQILERAFPEVNAQGDVTSLSLTWDQRYAMERNYDYGFVDVSTNSGSTWTTLKSFTNGGYQGYGIPKRWVLTDVNSHVTVDMSAYELMPNLKLRFRFDSDGAASSEDQPDNAQHSMRDGAWEVDNITWSKNSPAVVFWTDNGEAGNESVWQHVDTSASGQTGVTFWRGRFGVDFVTGREFTCDSQTGWMMGATTVVQPSVMVDDEVAWLMSPPIDISGAAKLVGRWDMWVDLPQIAHDSFNLWLASNDLKTCVTKPSGFQDEEPGGWFGGPFWGTWTDSWDAFAGNDWLAILWTLSNNDVPETDHMAGIFLNRQRVGIPSGDAGTTFELDAWQNFNDWFKDEIDEANADTALVKITDDDGIASAFVVASNDGGTTWNSHALLQNPDSDWYRVAPLTAEMGTGIPGKVIRFYYQATDAVGNTKTYPTDAPDVYMEMSVLPILGSTTSPAMLLVDKHGRRIPSEQRDYFHSSEYYYREMLEILGYRYDKYDVEVPSGTRNSLGPDSVGMKYYDTQIWFFDNFDIFNLWGVDQRNLIDWLNMSGSGKERNLLLTGNDVGFELKGPAQNDTLAFYETWLASLYLDNMVGSALVDSLPTLQDRAAGYNFMTYADKKCVLPAGCPTLNNFDVVDKYPGIPGNEVVADYKKVDTSTRPAGVAYTHATLGYQTVNLGFGMEFMMDSLLPSGYYKTGIADRVDLMRNIMLYFGKNPTGTPTGIVDGGYKNMLSLAYPNPFNPVTKIAYSVKEAGPVTIEVYNVAGKVVRTLLNSQMDAGASGYVTWDGMADGGEKCASGVYFYRLNAPGFTETQKMIMLK